MRSTFFILMSITAFAGCTSTTDMSIRDDKKVKLITLDPGHFHSALVQKSTYADVDSVVHVYAPEGSDVQLHLEKIESYNTRAEEPTNWKQEVYLGDDFLEKMLSEKKGNVVMLAGNNLKKTSYIKRSIDAGFNVYADKPMAIDAKSFEELIEAFAVAENKKLLLYDIMTERFEITTMLQKEFSLIPEVFGTLEKGSLENPAVTKESVHHFYKYVSGSVLTRPAWFFDVAQEGEGIVDVTTHLVDLIQWECFPDQIIDYKKDIEVKRAQRSETGLSLAQFKAITKVDQFPDYLEKYVTKDSILNVFSNGEFDYKIRDVHAKVSVKWVYKAPEGAGDTHYSIMRGSRANLIIRQGPDQQYKPALYIEPAGAETSEYGTQLAAKLKDVQKKFPGVELRKLAEGWEVIVPDKYKEGHEAHFARVTEKFLEYLKKKNLPAWEVPNMIAKYYTTIQALEIAKKGAQ
ncbi:MAG: putative oxidoreductase C-terminal domain-containing protein [Daejeonella sp.]|uniref:putative oxidoreductase C-terminal domain-containing protein n=1 Tax=Daejeonella sp. TaxID=2805397 RepID=UPI003C781B1D